METSFVNLMRGDPAPRFQAATTGNPHYIFDTVAGRYVVLCFFVSGSTPGGAAALQAVAANRHRFDDERLCFFGVTVDPNDRNSGRVEQSLPGVRYFLDFDGSVSKSLWRNAARGRGGDAGRARGSSGSCSIRRCACSRSFPSSRAARMAPSCPPVSMRCHRRICILARPCRRPCCCCPTSSSPPSAAASSSCTKPMAAATPAS